MVYAFPNTPFFSDWWNNYIGRPWLAGGYSFVHGFDCGGLVLYTTKFDRGCPLGDPRDPITYPPKNDRARRAAAMKERIQLYMRDWERIRDEDRIDGTAVLMRRSGEPKHLGVWMDRDHILHADEKAGCVLMDPAREHEGTILGYFLPKIVVNANINNGETIC